MNQGQVEKKFGELRNRRTRYRISYRGVCKTMSQGQNKSRIVEVENQRAMATFHSTVKVLT